MDKITKKKEVFVVADIAQAHDGSMGIAHSFIDALAGTGIDAVKFQTHIAEAESSMLEPFRIKFSFVDKNRYEYWKRIEFSEEQWRELKNHVENSGMQFLSSPFSIEAFNLLEHIGVKYYKIASGEVGNYVLMKKVAETGKPVILSSGMSNYSELDLCVEFFKKYKNEISVLQCTTQYPSNPTTIGLNVIHELRKRYNVPVGLSDHSGSIFPPLAAAALGAEIIEFHAVFDKRMFGPDSKASLEIDEITMLVKGIRYIEMSLNSPIDKENILEYSELKNMFGKALAVNKNLCAGHKITEDDLETKKPCSAGIPVKDYLQVLGKSLRRGKNKYDFLQYDDIQ